MHKYKRLANKVQITLLFIVSLAAMTPLIVNAQEFFKIDIKPVSIHMQASYESKVLHSLYSAKFLKVMSLQGKWVKVEFTLDGKGVIGWVEKSNIQVQAPVTRAIVHEPKNILVKGTNNREASTKGGFFDQQAHKVKVIGNEMHCTYVSDKKLVTGCVLDIDVEVNGPKKAKLAEISCKAEFELKLLDGQTKSAWETKRVRTPLKNEIGAARLQLAILPLYEKVVQAINVQSYQCRLEKIN
jgi:hypothetical protein